MYDNRPIGIFDSGVGGLSIYREVKKLLPRESFIYLADQKNNPYGGRSVKEIQNLSSDVVSFLINQNTKAIIVACNTATVYAIDYLRSKFDIPIIGIVPVVKTAAKKTKIGRIGILSTVATAESDYKKELIKKFANGLKVFNIGTDKIVPFIERGEVDSNKLIATLKEVLKQFTSIDVLALGCSHYPFLRQEIQKILGPKILILDSGPACARQVKRVLENNKMLSNKKGAIKFFTTENPWDFRRVAEKLIKKKLATVEKAII